MPSAILRIVNSLSSFFSAAFRPIIAGLAFVWRPFQALDHVLLPTRASALTVFAGGILLATPQGAELAVRLKPNAAVEDDWVMYPAFLLAVTLFAFQAWYWARIALEIRRGSDHRQDGRWYTWTPRFYALIAFVLASKAHLNADDTGHAIWTFLAGAVFFIFTIVRMPLGQRLNMTRVGHADPQNIAEMSLANKAVLYGSILFSFVMFAAFLSWPVALGQRFGAAAIAFFAFSQIVPVVSYALIRSRHWNVPIVTTAFVCAVLFSPLNDNHAVALMESPYHSEHRPSVGEAAHRWLGHQVEPSDTALPVVFISTAGGGLRAAYWTTTVIGTLEDRCPGFRNRIFSISGVSGGSVGTAVYAAAHRAVDRVSQAGPCVAISADRPMTYVMQAALSADFLGPTVSAMLYPDLVQRFLPFPLLPDRGAALSSGWNAAFRAACEDHDESCDAEGGDLDSAFLEIAGLPGAGDSWNPILLLNGTHQETGKRFIAANVRIEPPAFLDSFDMHEVLQADVSLASAALNSARFTYVSPAGLLKDTAGKSHGHVLDGGYFENYGAVTGAEVAREAIRSLELTNRAIRPIFVQISSDPELSAADMDKDERPVWPPITLGGKDGEAPLSWLNEIRGPALGLMHTREARGTLANKTLQEILARHQDEPYRFPTVVAPLEVHFRLCESGGVSPPLGWVMSGTSEAVIARHLDADTGCGANASELGKLIEALSVPIPVVCSDLVTADGQGTGRKLCRAAR